MEKSKSWGGKITYTHYSGRNFALLEFREIQNLGPKISRNSQYIITYIIWASKYSQPQDHTLPNKNTIAFGYFQLIRGKMYQFIDFPHIIPIFNEIAIKFHYNWDD